MERHLRAIGLLALIAGGLAYCRLNESGSLPTEPADSGIPQEAFAATPQRMAVIRAHRRGSPSPPVPPARTATRTRPPLPTGPAPTLTRTPTPTGPSPTATRTRTPTPGGTTNITL